MLSAIQLVLAGGIYLPSLLLGHEGLAESSTRAPTVGRGNTRGLTERQLQVLALLAQGMPNKVIARTLDITEGTVKVHLAAIFQTLGVRNRTEAVIVAQQMDLTPYRV
jgi:DNA-binding NarL/FixJ family response regulator